MIEHPAPASADDTASGGWPRIRTILSTLFRLGMGVLFIAAGYSKVINIPMSQVSVESYQIFSRDIAHIIGIVLPIAEIILGVLLLLGVATRYVAAIIAVLLVAFIAGIASLWIRDINVQCGCFGTSPLAQGEPDFLGEILRDSGMLLATLWLVLWPRTYLSVDGWLHDRAAVETDDEFADDEATDELDDPVHHEPSGADRA